MKRLLMLVLVVAALLASPAAAFTDVCITDPGWSWYCDDVGKSAYNFLGSRTFRNIYLGPIIGVAWRPVGSIVSAPGREVQLSPRDAFYYIIGPGGVVPYTFLRMAREIDPR